MIQPDSFAKLFHLLDALQARAGTRTALSVGVAASVAALTIILRLFTAKKPKLITDYAKVARKVDDSGLEFDEWDFIVVGGGMVITYQFQQSELHMVINLSRHSRMCSGIASF
jgi:choline dehydrogenase